MDEDFEFDTETGCRIRVVPNHTYFGRTPDSILVLRMADPGDYRWAEVLLTPSERRRLANILLRPELDMP